MYLCKYCKKIKSYEEFRFRNRDGLIRRTSQCLSCYNEYQRRYYENRKEEEPEWYEDKVRRSMEWQRNNIGYKKRKAFDRILDEAIS